MADLVSAEPLGEFERVRRFFAPLAGPGGLGLLDDAAIVDCRAGQRLVVTADAIVAGVHYLPDDPADLVARKLLRVNLSDLAAMGARPLYYLLTTALPAALGSDWVADFPRGLAEDQRRGLGEGGELDELAERDRPRPAPPDEVPRHDRRADDRGIPPASSGNGNRD